MPKDVLQKPLFVAGILLLLLSVAFYDVVFLGRTFKATTANSQALTTGAYGQENNRPRFIPVNGTDAPVLEEPLYQFIKNNLRRGIFPLWNPHQACGYPLIAMLEVGMFFPLSLIMYVFPSFYAWDVLILTRLFLAGLFTYWLMRRLKFGSVPALSSAIMFMLSGPLILLQYWTTNVDILTPLLFITSDILIRKKQLRYCVPLALAAGMSILAGHPEHVFLVNAYNAAFFLFRMLSDRRAKQSWKMLLKYFCLANALGLGLSALGLFPFIHNLLFESWHAHPPGTGLLMEEQRDRFLTLALPFFFQKETLTYRWSFSGWWGGYLGVLPLGLAFLSLWNKQKNGLNYFFAIVAFILIGKQYGLPIINALGHLPFFNLCRYAIHSPGITALTIALLGGMGVRTLLGNRKTFFKTIPFAAGLSFVTAVHLFLYRTSEIFPIALRASLLGFTLLIILQTIAWVNDRKLIPRRALNVVVIGVIFLELFLYIHRERPDRFDSFPNVPYVEFLKSSPEKVRSYGIFWAFYPNTASGFSVDDLGNFCSLLPERFVNFVNRLVRKNNFQKDLRPPALRAMPLTGDRHIMDLLNLKYVVSPSAERMSEFFKGYDISKYRSAPVYSGEVNVFERPTAFPRTFIVHRVIFLPDTGKTLQLLGQMGPRLRHVAILNYPAVPKILQRLQTVPVQDNSSSEIETYTPNKVIVKARLEHPGFLVFGDAFHPDWKACLNNQEIKIYQTDYLLRSVFLPQGDHVVTFVFRPASFYAGCWISFLSACGILALLFSPSLAAIFARRHHVPRKE